MPATLSQIMVVPPTIPGVSGYVDTTVSITSATGASAVAYTTLDGSTAFTFPATVSSPTTFYLPYTGTFTVSALIGSQQVATTAYTAATVSAINSAAAVVVECAAPRDNQEELSSRFLLQTQTQSAETVRVVAFEVQPFTSGSAPFGIHVDSFANTGGGAGTYNHLVQFGWNPKPPYEAGTTNQPSIQMGMEDNYFDPTDSTYGSEWYVQHHSKDASIQFFRPFYARIENSGNTARTANIQLDIGTTSGNFSIFQGKENPALVNLVSSALTIRTGVAIRATGFELGPTTGQPLMILNRTTGGGPIFQFQFSGSPVWSLMATSTTNMTIYDKDSAAHVSYTYGASAAAAISDFRSQVKVQGNLTLGATTSAGGGVLVASINNATTVPTTNPTGGGILYAEAGALKWRGSSGTVTTLAAA